MSKYQLLVDNPASLNALLSVAEPEDLSVLVDYLTDSGVGRLALDGDVCKVLVQRRKAKLYFSQDREQIGKELLLFGGNTLANAYRGLSKGTVLGMVLPEADETVDYLTLLKDVAKQTKAAYDNENVMTMEASILMRIFNKALSKMTDAEVQKVLADLKVANVSDLLGGASIASAGMAIAQFGAPTALYIAKMVASVMSTQIAGRAALGFAPVLVPSATALAGPIGLAIGSLWTLAGLASPASRVTVPCVVQLAYMRQRYLASANTVACPKCAVETTLGSKFCAECGAPMTP